MNLEDFFIKGYAKGHYSNEENLSFFDSFEFTHAEDVEVTSVIDDQIIGSAETKMLEIGNFLVEEYLKKVFNNAKLARVSMWQGVDSTSSDWHNDLYKTNRSTSILLYLDKNDKHIGNAIEFKNQLEEFIEYPDRGDFVIMNMSRQFKHKATHIPNTQRRLLCFDCVVPELVS